MSSPTAPKVYVLAVGINQNTAQILETLLPRDQIIEREYNLEALMEEQLETLPSIIVCGQAPEGISLIEAAQVLRMQNQSIPIVYVTAVRVGFDQKSLKKNGFDEAFLMPMDGEVFEQFMKDAISNASKGAIRSFRSVKLIDIKPNQALSFDTFIFFPMNKKYVKYSAAGDPIDEDRTKTLQKHSVNSIHVPQEQMKRVYEYTAEQLRSLGKDATMSETEKRDKTQTAIRELMSGMFNDSAKEATVTQGRQILADCQGIVKSYIVGSELANGNWYEKLMGVTGNKNTSYSHSANTATYAALFSMGMGIGVPEQMAIAGLLHDIGLADVPQDIQLKPESMRTVDEQKLYERHPEYSVSLIKIRKMIVPEIVAKIIMQHHEKFSGGGFPHNLTGTRILREAQVLAMADEFDELTSTVPGKKTMTPLEALTHMRLRNINDPSHAPYDPALVQQLYDLFVQKSAATG